MWSFQNSRNTHIRHHNRNMNMQFEVVAELICWVSCYSGVCFLSVLLFRLRSIVSTRASVCLWTAISSLTSTIAWRRWRPSTPYRSAAVWPSPSSTDVCCVSVLSTKDCLSCRRMLQNHLELMNWCILSYKETFIFMSITSSILAEVNMKCHSHPI